MVSFLVASVALLGATASAASVARRQTEIPCGATEFQEVNILTGYNLTYIAQRYQSGICDIANFNGIRNSDFIQAEWIIQVPKCAAGQEDNTSCLGGKGYTGTSIPDPVNPPCQAASVARIQIKRGDTVYGYSQRFQSSICDIKNYNKLQDASRITAGDFISIPVKCQKPAADNTCPTNGRRQTTTPPPCGSSLIVDHVVAANQTLSLIASNYTSGICDIASLNKIQNPNFIQVGQVLRIPTKCTTPDNTSCLPPPNTATAVCINGVGSSYNVRSGETLTIIAGNFNVTLNSVIAANSDIDPNVISPGQLINIPVCPHSCCDWIGTYEIKSGDTFAELARKMHTTVGQIMAVNAKVDPTKLAIKQQIILPANCRT
ncbi:hypothetical protein LEMA_P070100.1 [Plenodomus lingam JN3]|uniref:LysM domain-containing protein n=1 Tax=Leptosphaeria maculans (strain JN3 / isolate v23.1.3 / race Av1-4-5-6-7-8) TaxID=985895 RepID=E4ZJ71_LEPMJ|nr:hypothetical protein LEMA_P070100.1 [Plenodomus lingam JN3]CBX91502.1 hypothetical protein LEMA_P070100.1 [Plenodomus lingam JN3]